MRRASKLIPAVMFTLAVVAVVAAIVGLVSWGAYGLTAADCRRVEAVAQLDTRMAAWTCYVEVEPGQWIPYDRWRVDE
jgi:hypothetical protein